MHLALIVPAPADTVSGGYAYDRRIAAGLRERGHGVDVVALAGLHPVADDTARDAACAVLDALRAGTRPVIDGLALPAFAGLDDALAAQGAIGLIHHPAALETGLDETTRTALGAIEKRLYARLNRIVVTSQPTADRIAAEFGVDRARIAVVVPGTDDASRCTGSTGASCEILSVGALVPRKGHDLLIRALARLFDLDWRLTIVGSPARNPTCAHGLLALTEQLGVASRVRFAGEVPDDALETLWRGADLFALATYFEGYGMAIAEALKHGLPVAVTDGGAAGALVDPEAGVVCTPGDQEQLSKALRRLIFSQDLRRDMAEAAWKTGQLLPSWRTQADLFAQAIA